MRPLVSVIVPLYNSAGCMLPTVRAILMQDYPHLELLLVDDGSTDSTPQLAQALARRDQRVRFWRKPNAGVASARNYALARARGELVALCDHDDLWLPERLSAQVPLFEQEGVGLVYSDVLVEHRGRLKLREQRLWCEGWCLEKLVEYNFIPSCSVLVRREALEEAGGFEEHRDLAGVDDKLAWIRIARRWQIRAVRRVLAVHTIAGRNYSLKMRRMLVAELTCLALAAQEVQQDNPRHIQALRRGLRRVLVDYGLGLILSGDPVVGRWALKEAWRRGARDAEVVWGMVRSFLPQLRVV